ncbi:unnamed protein product [Paramecium pentaurelia]|uniref:Protein kinase domain-containing protein n=1 Tax=Paramecium pentaurelia TaxID=43138 RepID=A0A8S1UUA0_9CILI|nr:unnamed protein product [Paramecium pentaurelia]
MLCGETPFHRRQKEERFRQTNIEVSNFYAWEQRKISEEVRNLGKKMLIYDPTQRISAEESFNDPWIQQNAPNVPIDQNSIQNLSSFFGKNMLRTAFMQFIFSTNLMTNQEKEVLRKEFLKIISYISKDELVQGFNQNYYSLLQIILENQFKKMVDDIFEEVVIQIFQSLSHQLLLKKQQETIYYIQSILGWKAQISRDDLQESMQGIDDNLQKKILVMCDYNKKNLLNFQNKGYE